MDYKKKDSNNRNMKNKKYEVINFKPLPIQNNGSSNINKDEIQKFKDIRYAREYCYSRNPKFKEDLEISSFINHGSCGMVFAGEIKNSNNKKIALKLHISNKISKLKRESFIKREIRIQNKLKDKNVINLYGVYEVGDDTCMVMEYGKYGDLDHFQKLIQKKTFNETLLAYLTKQILCSLIYCHKNKIAHLDIKQQNILIDENLIVKLTDFSVSQEYSDEEIPLPLVGTSLFMSPEILARMKVKPYQIEKIDLYSLGILLYHLAFGIYPYLLDIVDKKAFDTIRNKIQNNKLFIPTMKKHSDCFRDFLQGILQKDLEKRMSLEEAMNHPWMKSAEQIFLEKEKIGDLEKFLISLVTDNVISFNDCLSKYDMLFCTNF
jgi:serine/threonine protein kinase